MSLSCPRVWNKRDPKTPTNAVYVGRPTKWGNPFRIGRDGDREQCVALYHGYVEAMPMLKDAIREQLRGKDLVCWCSPLSCHADVLLIIANGSS